jgi:cation diffusion facilitator family transporter
MVGSDRIAAGRAGRRVTWVGIGWNAVLVGAKLIAGLLGHSQAMVADAIHSVSDFLTDMVVLLGLRFGRQDADADHHFGHGRIETLASALVGVSLLLVAGFLVYQAAGQIHDRIHGLPVKSPNWLALVGALVSIAVKEGLYHYTVRVGRHIKSPVVTANAWHHRSDALSSAAALIGIGGAMIQPDWVVLDSLAAVVVALLVGRVGLRVLWSGLREMTDAAPSSEVVRGITVCAAEVDGVQHCHNVKVRTSGGQYHVHVHITVDRDLRVHQGHAIAEQVERCLLDAFDDMGEVIVHVDPSE